MGIQLRATVGLAALALLLPASAATAVAEPTASSGHSAIAKRVSDFTWEGYLGLELGNPDPRRRCQPRRRLLHP